MIYDKVSNYYSEINLQENLNDFIENFIKSTEIKLIINNPNYNLSTPISLIKLSMPIHTETPVRQIFKEVEIDNKIHNINEFNFTNDIYLKNKLKFLILNKNKFQIKKFNSEKILPNIKIRDNLLKIIEDKGKIN